MGTFRACLFIQRDGQRHRLQNKINRRYVHLNPNVGMRTLHDFGSKENSSCNRKQTTRTQVSCLKKNHLKLINNVTRGH